MFSRERLAGYDPSRMQSGLPLIVGVGALGNNILQTFALSGAGNVRIIDPQTVSRSNLPRSPMFRRNTFDSARDRFKAKEAAITFLQQSYADAPSVEYAVAEVQDLGFGAFTDVSVIISAVDSDSTRAYLCDAARWLGIPIVEAGFSGSRFHVTTFSNRDPDSACLRCLRPFDEDQGYSCSLYAEAVIASGGIPATQSVASACGALVAEAAIQAIHDNIETDACLLSVDIRTWETSRVQITRDPYCSGLHRRATDILVTDIQVSEPILVLLERSELPEPELLVHPFVVTAPCARCGASVSVRKPARHIKSPPVCDTCPSEPATLVLPPHVATRVGQVSQLANASMKSVRLAPGTLVEVISTSSATRRVLRLAGDPLSRFSRRSRCHALPTGADNE